MASIDWSLVGLGALVGVGCRKQLRTASRIAATTAASLAGAAAQAVNEVAKETSRNSEKSAEEVAAEAKLREIDEKLRSMSQDLYGQDQNGQNGGH